MAGEVQEFARLFHLTWEMLPMRSGWKMFVRMLLKTEDVEFIKDSKEKGVVAGNSTAFAQ